MLAFRGGSQRRTAFTISSSLVLIQSRLEILNPLIEDEGFTIL